MARRSIFDNALAELAANAGANLLPGTPARALEHDFRGVRLRVERPNGREEMLEADFMVGADGANGIAARASGLRPYRALAIGMEVEHPYDWQYDHPNLRPDVLHLEFGAVKNGYAWIFPKGDHLNVGAGLFRPRAVSSRGDSGIRDELRRAILGYLDAFRIPYDLGRMTFHAHPLPLWNGNEPLNTPAGRILLAGDAAGMINPLFGDGILHAVRSGIIAARAIADDRPAEYTARIHGKVASNFEAARRLAGPFYQFSGTVYRSLIHRPNATRAAARLLAGEAFFTEAASRAFSAIRPSLGPRRSSGSATE
jgi:flavin-dependent dehydrogenase